MSRVLQIEKELLLFLDTMPVGVTPGLQVQAIQKGQRVLDVRWGQTYSYYDLASLTKPLFTSMAYARAFELGKVNVDQTVQSIWSGFPYTQITVKELLNHSSHLEAYRPFFKDLPPVPQEDSFDKLLSLSLELPLNSKEGCTYSDIGFFVLGKLLTIIFDKSLLEVWQDTHSYFYPNNEGLHFCSQNQPLFPKDRYAPTARCPWRDQLVQGQVHDEHAWLMGGVAPHAGLFGSIDDVMWAILAIRAQMIGIGKKLLKQKTAKLFFERSVTPDKGDWALGFMLPTAQSSSAGDFFSLQSVGHLGFTGVSFWFDPDQDLIVTLLSNRVFFGRDNKEFNEWRPKIHNQIFQLLRKY